MCLADHIVIMEVPPMKSIRITSPYWIEEVTRQGGDFRIVWATIIAG